MGGRIARVTCRAPPMQKHQCNDRQCNEARKDAQQRQTARVLPVAEGKMTGGEIPLICSTEARRSFRWHTTRCSLLIMS